MNFSPTTMIWHSRANELATWAMARFVNRRDAWGKYHPSGGHMVDRFVDFSRSLASQETMCELVACYIFGTYFLDAFHVVGYLWPNGEPGAGKPVLLQVIAELAYLGQLILAKSSFPCLRDMADYGATLAFDDAENIMDIRQTDPINEPCCWPATAVAPPSQLRSRWVTPG